VKNEALNGKNHRPRGASVLPFGRCPTVSDFEHCLEWVRLGTAHVRGHAACVARHRQILRARKETEKRLKAIHHWRESDAFVESEKAALSLSEAISLQGAQELSTLILQNARRHFTADEIVRLTLTVIAVNDWIDLHATSRIRILVVEDNTSDQELLLRQMAKTQMAEKVLFVPDGLQALELIEKSRESSEPELIAIFLDLHLPGMSGIELLRRIRTVPGMEDFPVIVMTSSADPRDIEKCRRLKVSSYVEKPISYNSFSHVIANVFHSKQS